MSGKTKRLPPGLLGRLERGYEAAYRVRTSLPSLAIFRRAILGAIVLIGLAVAAQAVADLNRWTDLLRVARRS